MKPKLQQLYAQRRVLNLGDNDDTHVVLADLRSPVYLTTNYDDFMFQAIQARASANGVKDPKRDFCRWSDKLFETRNKWVSPFDSGFQPTRSEPIVYHLHGHAEVPDSIVVSEDDYTDFIVNTSAELIVGKGGKAKRERVPGAIRDALCNNQLLFVGYRLADQNLHVLLRMVTLKLGIKKLNLAIQLSPSLADTDPKLVPMILKYLEDRYEWSLKLQVYWGDAREFAAELRKHMVERSSAVAAGGNAA